MDFQFVVLRVKSIVDFSIFLKSIILRNLLTVEKI